MRKDSITTCMVRGIPEAGYSELRATHPNMSFRDLCKHDCPGPGCVEIRQKEMGSPAEGEKSIAMFGPVHRPVEARMVVEAKKFDQGKARWDLVPIETVEEAAEVLAFGADKYGERNWELGLPYSRLYAAAMRHLSSFWQGEDIDSESGLPHLAHVHCCIMMLAKQNPDLGYAEFDDRPPRGRPD